jgi:hypothetical protein
MKLQWSNWRIESMLFTNGVPKRTNTDQLSRRRELLYLQSYNMAVGVATAMAVASGKSS